MRLTDILKDVSYTAENSINPEISDLIYDSRKVKEGTAFFCLKGYTSNGHDYARSAVEKGAAALIISDELDFEVPENVAVIRTDDTRLALALASREFFGVPEKELMTVAITGTKGKTTTAAMIAEIFEHAGIKAGTIGTLGIVYGGNTYKTDNTTPESYELHKLFREMLDRGCTHVVMEVSSHSLTLERVAGICFDVAIFTNLSQDHLDLHGTMDAYAEAKKKIFSQCRVGCINADDARADFMAEGVSCPILRYSAADNNADLTAKDIRLTSSGVRFAAVHGGELALTKLAIPGMFSVYNALGVMAAGLALGLSLEQCAAGLGSAAGVKGRMESVPTDGDYSIIIDYSHKPDALEKALKALRPVTRGRLVALFGCGGDRDRGKRPIMGAIAAQNADLTPSWIRSMRPAPRFCATYVVMAKPNDDVAISSTPCILAPAVNPAMNMTLNVFTTDCTTIPPATIRKFCSIIGALSIAIDRSNGISGTRSASNPSSTAASSRKYPQPQSRYVPPAPCHIPVRNHTIRMLRI